MECSAECDVLRSVGTAAGDWVPGYRHELMAKASAVKATVLALSV